MARTPGQAPGSGRSGEWDQSPSRWPVSQVGEVLSGYREGTPGKTGRVGRSRGTWQGPQGEDVGGPGERGVTRKPGEKGAPIEGRPPSPTRAACSEDAELPQGAPQSAPGSDGWGAHPPLPTRPPSLVGSTSTLRGSRSPTQARLAEASVAATQVTYSLGSSRFPLGRSCHRLFLGAALPLGQSLRPSVRMHQTGSQGAEQRPTLCGLLGPRRQPVLSCSRGARPTGVRWGSGDRTRGPRAGDASTAVRSSTGGGAPGALWPPAVPAPCTAPCTAAAAICSHPLPVGRGDAELGYLPGDL